MKFVVIGEPSGASMEAIMAKFSRYKAVVDAFVARADHQLRQLPAGYRDAVCRRLHSSDLRRSLRKCAFPRIMRMKGVA